MEDVESNPGPRYCMYCGKGKSKDPIMAQHLIRNHYETLIWVQMLQENGQGEVARRWIKKEGKKLK